LQKHGRREKNYLRDDKTFPYRQQNFKAFSIFFFPPRFLDNKIFLVFYKLNDAKNKEKRG
jgi:hypothetical protein